MPTVSGVGRRVRSVSRVLCSSRADDLAPIAGRTSGVAADGGVYAGFGQEPEGLYDQVGDPLAPGNEYEDVTAKFETDYGNLESGRESQQYSRAPPPRKSQMYGAAPVVEE